MNHRSHNYSYDVTQPALDIWWMLSHKIQCQLVFELSLTYISISSYMYDFKCHSIQHNTTALYIIFVFIVYIHIFKQKLDSDNESNLKKGIIHVIKFKITYSITINYNLNSTTYLIVLEMQTYC